MKCPSSSLLVSLLLAALSVDATPGDVRSHRSFKFYSNMYLCDLHLHTSYYETVIYILNYLLGIGSATAWQPNISAGVYNLFIQLNNVNIEINIK